MAINEDSIASSFGWKLLERGAAQIITLIVQIVLARILLPDEFGVIAILLVFINIANVFIQKGFASSLIRKENVNDDDYSTAFVVSEIIAFVCVIIFWLTSEKLESFYSIDGLGVYMRILSISLMFGALYSIQNAELVRNMRFKQIFYRSVLASIVSGVIGIVVALLGFGVWALVVQTLSQQVTICVTTLFICNWKPKVSFSKESFNELFSFGSKILIAEIISIGVENLRTLIIGKKYAASDLAYYDRGQVYPATAMRSIYDAIGSVLLPTYSKVQNDKERLAEMVELSLEIAMFLIAPLFVGFATISRPFILLLLTEKWEGAIPYLIIFCLYQIAFPMYGILRQSMYALGKSNDVLKLEIVRSVVFIVMIVIGSVISPLFIAILSGVAMYLTTFIYYVALKKYLPLKSIKLFRNNSISIIQCIIMIIILVLLNRLNIPNYIQLLLDIVVGAAIYLVTSIIFRNNSFEYCMSFIKKKRLSK